ncbi:MAG TPA: hypothetical protein VEA61_07460 [Allosphingosinicella sp.]|nr:hypothetical protein [Allosphingosinicella sp.]
MAEHCHRQGVKRGAARTGALPAAALLALAACGDGGGSEAASAPAPAAARHSPAQLRAALLAVNRDTAPFVVRDGRREGVDLVAEWKIVDARWYEIFAKAGLTRVFKVLIKLDPSKGEVRSVDQAWRVEWRAGVPTLAADSDWFRGRTWEKSAGTAYAFRESGRYGEVYDYRFDTEELKAPLRTAVREAGWVWRPVSFGRL